MAGRDAALAELDRAYEHFRSRIAGLPATAWDEPWLGEWNLGQVLAHMAGWWREMTPAFARVARGERPVPQGVDYSDEDAYNARFAANASRGADSLAAWDAAFAAYRAAAAELDPSLYGDGQDGRPLIGNRLLQGAGIGHFAEHQPALDAWLAGRG